MLDSQLWKDKMLILQSVLIAITFFFFSVLSKNIKLLGFAYEDEMEIKDYVLIVNIVY